ncbi:glycine--tRNA ligase [bacterium]|nr:glycine--tRNA ligase [bacterium]
MEKVVNLCKRRGIIFQSSEIYGGLSSSYDFGPLGVELKRNIKNIWWKNNVQGRKDIVGLDAAILMHPKVWQASGHISGFSDPLVECKSCHRRFRADEVKDKCPICGGELTEAKMFNLMFKTFMGPVEDDASVVYLRPETAQGIFINFENIRQTARMKIPFGIAQIGKTFRNEITPGNFIFRTREFEQMEIEFFVHPKEVKKWYEYWQKERLKWYIDLGIKKENLRLRKHKKNELAHYAAACSDIEYKFPWGWAELEGIANRQNFDLKQHSKFSGQDLSYFDEETKEKYIPYIIEPSAGVERSLLAFLIDAYEEVSGGRTKTTKSTKEKEIILHLDKRLAPIKIAILPLVRKKPLVKLAKEIFNSLKSDFNLQYDEVGSIGRRYRRQDEIGTPFCLTIDFESLEDKKVTVRDRDTMKQDRIFINELREYFWEKFK